MKPNLLNSSSSNAVASASISSSSLKTSCPTYLSLSLPNNFQISSLTELREDAWGAGRLFAGGGDIESESESDKERKRLRSGGAEREDADINFDGAAFTDPGGSLELDGVEERLDFGSVLDALCTTDDDFKVELPLVLATDDFETPNFFMGAPDADVENEPMTPTVTRQNK